MTDKHKAPTTPPATTVDRELVLIDTEWGNDHVIRPPQLDGIFQHGITAVSIGIELRRFGEIRGSFPVSAWGPGPDGKLVNLPIPLLPPASYDMLLALSMEVILEDLVVFDHWRPKDDIDHSTYSRAWFMSHCTIIGYEDPTGAVEDAEEGHTTLAKAFGSAWTPGWTSGHDALKRGALVEQNLRNHTAIIGEMLGQNFIFGKTTDGSDD
jgi:hypothetical protein